VSNRKGPLLLIVNETRELFVNDTPGKQSMPLWTRSGNMPENIIGV
jgi:hypothetical protein